MDGSESAKKNFQIKKYSDTCGWGLRVYRCNWRKRAVLVMTHVNGLTFKSSQRGTINRRPCLKHSLLLSIVGC